MTLTYVLAQVGQANPPADWTQVLLNSGIIGVFMVLFLIGRIFAKSTVDDLKERIEIEAKRAETERERADKADATIKAFTEPIELMNHILSEIKNRVEKP